jgi:hypothetical protein
MGSSHMKAMPHRTAECSSTVVKVTREPVRRQCLDAHVMNCARSSADNSLDARGPRSRRPHTEGPAEPLGSPLARLEALEWGGGEIL